LETWPGWRAARVLGVDGTTNCPIFEKSPE